MFFVEEPLLCRYGTKPRVESPLALLQGGFDRRLTMSTSTKYSIEERACSLLSHMSFYLSSKRLVLTFYDTEKRLFHADPTRSKQR